MNLENLESLFNCVLTAFERSKKTFIKYDGYFFFQKFTVKTRIRKEFNFQFQCIIGVKDGKYENSFKGDSELLENTYITFLHKNQEIKSIIENASKQESEIYQALKPDYIARFSISGGEPLEEDNLFQLNYILCTVKSN